MIHSYGTSGSYTIHKQFCINKDIISKCHITRKTALIRYKSDVIISQLFPEKKYAAKCFREVTKNRSPDLTRTPAKRGNISPFTVLHVHGLKLIHIAIMFYQDIPYDSQIMVSLQNTPIQIYRKFYHPKNENFLIKIMIFFTFLLKI